MFHAYKKFWPVRDRVSVQYSYSHQHDVTYQKTVPFTVTATTSNVTNIISFNIYQNYTTIKCKSLSQYKYFIPRKCCFIRQISHLTRKIGLRDYHGMCVRACVCVAGGGGVMSFWPIPSIKLASKRPRNTACSYATDATSLTSYILHVISYNP